MKDELTSFKKHWEIISEIVDKPKNAKIIKSKWMLTIKNDKENNDIRYKARLVAAGYNRKNIKIMKNLMLR